MTTANALSGPLFTEDNSYNSYEPTRYEKENYEKSSYRNDNYEQPEYSTYISDYKPQYTSYEQDRNSYKSKDSSSVSIKKINCNNVNVNLNGLDINATGTDGTDGSALEAASLIGNGNGNNEYGETNNYVERNNGFKFVCINNNNNTVVVEEEPVPPVDECSEAEEIEACFEDILFEGDFSTLVAALESGITVEINGEEVTLRSFADICLVLESATTYDEIISILLTIFREVIPSAILPNELTDCIAETLDIPIPPIET